MQRSPLISSVRPRFARRHCAVWLVACIVTVCGVGCDRNTSPYVGEEAPREPDLSRIFPEAEAPHAHAPDENAAAREDIAQETDRVGSARGPSIAGEVTLGDAPAPEGAMLFVIARVHGAAGGPPLAVLRVPNPVFPFAFELSQANVMIPSMRFDGEMDVTARLDVDGNAMTRDAGDLEGRADGSHTPGSTGVLIVLGPSGA